MQTKNQRMLLCMKYHAEQTILNECRLSGMQEVLLYNK